MSVNNLLWTLFIVCLIFSFTKTEKSKEELKKYLLDRASPELIIKTEDENLDLELSTSQVDTNFILHLRKP